MILVQFVLFLMALPSWAAPANELRPAVVADAALALLSDPRTIRFSDTAITVLFALPEPTAALAWTVMFNAKKMAELRTNAQAAERLGNLHEAMADLNEADILQIEHGQALVRLKKMVDSTLRSQARSLAGMSVVADQSSTSLKICPAFEGRLGVCAVLNIRLRKLFYEVLLQAPSAPAEVIAMTPLSRRLSQAGRNTEFRQQVISGYEEWLKAHMFGLCSQLNSLTTPQTSACDASH